MENAMVAVWIVVSLFIYFVPTFVAKAKNQPNFLSIFLINFFFGWSLIGWVIALVWAVKKPETVQAVSSHVSAGDEISKLKVLMEEGTITYDEFEAKKKTILASV